LRRRNYKHARKPPATGHGVPSTSPRSSDRPRRNGQDMTVWVRSTVCLRQIDGRWLITHEHISFPINPENWSAIVDTTP
jgi:hypothetical protein